LGLAIIGEARFLYFVIAFGVLKELQIIHGRRPPSTSVDKTSSDSAVRKLG